MATREIKPIPVSDEKKLGIRLKWEHIDLQKDVLIGGYDLSESKNECKLRGRTVDMAKLTAGKETWMKEAIEDYLERNPDLQSAEDEHADFVMLAFNTKGGRILRVLWGPRRDNVPAEELTYVVWSPVPGEQNLTLNTFNKIKRSVRDVLKGMIDTAIIGTMTGPVPPPSPVAPPLDHATGAAVLLSLSHPRVDHNES